MIILCSRKVRHDLVEQGKHGGAAAVDEALPADLDDVGVGEDREDRVRLCLRQQRLVGQGAVDERGAQLRQDADLALHVSPFQSLSAAGYGRRTTSMA